MYFTVITFANSIALLMSSYKNDRTDFNNQSTNSIITNNNKRHCSKMNFKITIAVFAVLSLQTGVEADCSFFDLFCHAENFFRDVSSSFSSKPPTSRDAINIVKGCQEGTFCFGKLSTVFATCGAFLAPGVQGFLCLKDSKSTLQKCKGL